MQTAGLDTIFRAIDVALDRRKLTLAFLGALAIIIGTGFFAYLAGTVNDGASAVIFLVMAGLAAWTLNALFSGALACMSWHDLTTGRKFTMVEALTFSSQHILSFALSPLALGVVGVAVVLAEVLLFMLGRIDHIGELLVSVLFLPTVIVNALLMVGVVGGSWLVFPIIAESGTDPIKTVRRVVDVVYRAPGRLVGNLILALFVVALTMLILWPLVIVGYTQTITLIGAGLGEEKMTQIVLASVLDALPLPTSILGLGRVLYGEVPFTIEAAGFLMGLETIVLLVGAIYVFPWVFLLTVSCAIYSSLTGVASAPASAAVPASPKPASISPSPSLFPVPPTVPAPPPVQPIATPYQPPPVASHGPQIPSAGSACIQCGRPINLGSHFCPYCGKPQS